MAVLFVHHHGGKGARERRSPGNPSARLLAGIQRSGKGFNVLKVVSDRLGEHVAVAGLHEIVDLDASFIHTLG